MSESRAGKPLERGDQTELFDCGTLVKLRRRTVQARERGRNILMRAALVVVIGWIPLFLLAAYQSAVLGQVGLSSFLFDYAATCRYLIAAPLLVAAEWVSLPRLRSIAFHFRDSGIVTKADHGRFDAAWASTMRLRDALAADVIIIVLAYALTMMLVATMPIALHPRWHVSVASGAYSLAGWWHAIVSLPLLFVLLFTWLYRLILWGRFLYLMSRLELRLMPAHPDRTAGLRFVAYSMQAFALVAFALGTIVAGATANRIVYAGAAPESFRTAIFALVISVVVLFGGPVLVFVPQLLRAWQRGTAHYSTIASRLGWEFERKWLRQDSPLTRDTLEVQDFSATTDLYQVVSNVYEVRLIPVSVASLGILVTMTIVPFLVLALFFTPVDVIVRAVARLLL
jgi:hypothetical protein